MSRRDAFISGQRGALEDGLPFLNKVAVRLDPHIGRGLLPPEVEQKHPPLRMSGASVANSAAYLRMLLALSAPSATARIIEKTYAAAVRHAPAQLAGIELAVVTGAPKLRSRTTSACCGPSWGRHAQLISLL